MNKKNIIIISVIAVVILVLGFILLKGCSKEKEKIEKEPAKEEAIKQAYNMSKEDAINRVKTIYNSDVYEFEAEINEDSKYIVTVKNTVTESVTKFLVDPATTSGSFYMIDE